MCWLILIKHRQRPLTELKRIFKKTQTNLKQEKRRGVYFFYQQRNKAELRREPHWPGCSCMFSLWPLLCQSDQADSCLIFHLFCIASVLWWWWINKPAPRKRSEACELGKTTNECFNGGGRKKMRNWRTGKAWKFFHWHTSSYEFACCLCNSAAVSCTSDLG